MSETMLHFDAILFDMDGTLIDSTAGVQGAWEYWGRKNPHLDIQDILRTSHGVRTIDNLRKFCPEIPEEQMHLHINEFEMEIVNSANRTAGDGKPGIVLLPGVKEIVKELQGKKRWAICTSAATPYATAALQSVGIPIPSVFVTADDVSRGKPFPDPYLLGAKKSGVKIENCLVVEDAPSGVASGKAAGAKVLALYTSHTKERMQKTDCDYLVDNLSSVTIELTDSGAEVTIRSPAH